MNPPLLVSFGLALITVALSSLWAVLIATGLDDVPEQRPFDPNDLRTW